MVLKYITKGGTRIHGPPYTKAEEAEFYRRQGRGPVTVVRPLMTVKSRSPEHRGSRRRQSQRCPAPEDREYTQTESAHVPLWKFHFAYLPSATGGDKLTRIAGASGIRAFQSQSLCANRFAPCRTGRRYSASTCASQKPMPIPPYISFAAVRCWRARSGLPERR
jgi:hypothetical protein